MSPLSAFQSLSIRGKLRGLVIGACASSLGVVCVALVFFAPAWTLPELHRELVMLAKLASHAAAPALEREDAVAGQRAMDALRADPRLLVAVVYRESGGVFTQFRRDSNEALPPFPLPAEGFHPDRLAWVESVPSASGAVLGKIYLRADPDWRRGPLRDALVVTLFAGGLGLLVALGFLARLEEVFTRPIHSVMQTAERVAREENFAARATATSPDELGQLANAFNDMLAHLQLRDADLRRHRDHLGELVAQRTAELMQLNQTLFESKAQTEEANRAKTHFFTSMSHELRTPLNAIIGYSELLIEEPSALGQPEALDDLRRIHTAGRKLLALINDLLALAKADAGKLTLQSEAFDLVGLARTALDTVQPLATKNEIRLELDAPPGPISLNADRAKLQQTVANLLDNACKFTLRGEVRLRLATEIVSDQPWVILQVIDTGIGMTEEQLSRLFQPFAQGHPATARKGSGLGLSLAISQRMIEAMGGELRAASAPNRGSTFTVRLPAQPPLATDSPKPAPVGEPAAPANGRPSVLVIDDDPHSRDLMVRFLQKEGFSPKTAVDGRQGLLMAKQLLPALITLDVLMPDVDGWSVLGALKADPALAKIPVVMITLTDEPDRGFALGAAEFLTKPVDYTRLSGLLREYCPTPGDRPILIVEDDEISRHLLRRNLEREGYPVMLAEDGRAALDQIRLRLPALILLDLMMPEMDGFAFAQAAREQKDLRDVPIIVLTAKDLTEEDRLRLKGNVTGILQKQTLSPENFQRELRAALANQAIPKPNP